MEQAKDLSRGSTKKRVYNPKKKTAGVGWDGGYDEVEIPNAFAVIDRGDKESRVRGWGIGGKWYDARTCKRCDDTGQDPTFYGDICTACKGSSYKPKV
jgi:DnaJ-class molecular chaperone